MASAGNEQRQIYILALACEDLFLKCYITPHFLPSKAAEDAKFQHEKFRIWGSYLGVFASYKLSLDKRLEYCDDIRELVVKLLELLRINLEFIVSKSTAPPMQEMPTSTTLVDIEKLQGTHSEALSAVAVTTTRLNKLGSAIRRQSATGIESRVRAFTEKHGDNNYTELARLIIQFKYNCIPPSLKERLALSMADRRQRLRYARRHQIKMYPRPIKMHTEPVTSAERGESSSGLSSNAVTPAAIPTSAPIRQVWPKKATLQMATQRKAFEATTAVSDTNATSFRPTQSLKARIRDGVAGSVISSSKESRTFMAEGLGDYPEPPKKLDGQAASPCPFCLKPLEASDLKTWRWKRHVNEDIKPFVCLADKCDEPPFETVNLWAEHMRVSHSPKWPQLIHKPVSWRCDVNHLQNMETFEFDDEDSFKEHLQAYHNDYTPAVQKSIARTSQFRRRRPANICPLCNYDISVLESNQLSASTKTDLYPATPNFGEFEELVDPAKLLPQLEKLAKHVASHLRCLAFDSVNNIDEEPEDDLISGNTLTSNADQQSDLGSQQRAPSDLKPRSRISTVSFDSLPGHGSGVEIQTFDKDWSQVEVDFLQSPGVELDDHQAMNWNEVRAILKPDNDMAAQYLADLRVHGGSAGLSTHDLTSEDRYFERQITILVKNKFPSMRQSLCEHIGSSIAYRRWVILRKRAHGRRLARRSSPKTSALSQEAPAGLSMPPSASIGTASILEGSTVMSRLRRGPIDATNSIGPALRQSSVEYPEPPKSGESTCPVCGTVQPVGLSEHEWRKHIDDDISPYVCLSGDCVSPFVFFTDETSWREHMTSRHTRDWARKVHTITWYCDIDHDGEHVGFNSRQGLHEHLTNRDNHPRRPVPPDAQLQVLLRTKQNVVEREDSWPCPFCDSSIEYLNATQATLDQHIGDHLLSVAFLSIPTIEALPVDQTSSGSESQQVEKYQLLGDGSVPSLPSYFSEVDFAGQPASTLFNDEAKAVPDEAAFADSSIPDTSSTYWNDINIHRPRQHETYDPHQDHIIQHFLQIQESHERTIRHFVDSESISEIHDGMERPDQSLGDEILGFLVTSKFDTKQEFLPEGYLDRLITRQALKDDLFVDKTVSDAEDERLIDFITKSAKKVFATAYFALGSGGSALLPTMMYFQSIGFSDKALPIEDLRTVKPTRNAKTEVPFPFNRNRNVALRRTWAPMRIRNFYQTQWMFLAPIFERGHFHHVLSSHIVLPFVWVDKVTKGGRFSKVYEVEIHKSHQRLLDVKDDGTQPHVAIKEILTTENDEDLKQEMENNFNLEASALSDIASLEHDHIIKRIAAISIDTRRYFMFQWADGGNLREFWKENSNPHLTPELVRQSVNQLRGLADALVSLHHYKDKANYRHGDLKPENVLRFNDGTFVGHFKIADMGLAKRHTEATDARGGPTSMKYGTTRYEPPETSTNLQSARSRLYDVWSLGCIILEYIIWLLYGHDELERFSDDIQIDTGCFYLCERGGDRPEAKVHPTVVTWMDCIGNDPECSTQTAIRDLLALVRDKLLVVALLTDTDTKSGFDDFISVTPADLVEPVPVAGVRARAKAVESALREILDLGEGNENYLLANSTRQQYSPSTSTPIPHHQRGKPTTLP